MSAPKSYKPTEDRLWPWAGKALAASVVIAALMLLFFRQVPAVDFYISNLFFVEWACSASSLAERCGKFWMVGETGWRKIREIGLNLPLIIMAGVCLWLTWLLMFKNDKKQQDLLPPFVAILAAALGPGIVTNGVLKEYWGRPRPFMTQMFGGEHPFVLPGTISDICETNCSFVSGEASSGFWMLVLSLFFAKSKRYRLGLVIGLLAIAIALLRVGFGRHFLSDVVMGGMVSIVCIFFGAWLFQTAPARKMIDSLVIFSNAHAFGPRKTVV